MWLNSFFCIWISSCSSTIYWKDYLCSIVLFLLFSWISIDYMYLLYLTSIDCIYRLLCSIWVKSLSRVQLFATPWIVAYQPALSIGFSRQEYWSGLPFPSPGDLPEPGIEPGSPTLQADVLPSEPPRKHVPFNCLLFLPISHSLV